MTSIDEKKFLEAQDLVDLGLYRDTAEVFRFARNKGKLPPYIRISKKVLRFPKEQFNEWLRVKTITSN